jgi:hypothetical protein
MGLTEIILEKCNVWPAALCAFAFTIVQIQSKILFRNLINYKKLLPRNHENKEAQNRK